MSLLQDLTNPDLLYTPYGLRSLAKSSPLYMKKEREDSNHIDHLNADFDK